MQKNDLFTIEITDIGVEGEGVGRYEGMTFFVKDTCIGDVVLVKAMKLKKNYGYARVEEVVTPSTFRVEPKCPLARKCGGCQLQQMSYEAQLAFKNRKVLNNLVRLGGFEKEKLKSLMLPIVGMMDPFRYRNKAQFPVGYDKEGNVVFGFYASHSHNIIPTEECYLGVKENAPILREIGAWMKEYGISAYNEETHKGLLRHVLLRYGFTSKELMVCLVVNGTKLPQADKLVERLTGFNGMTSISMNVNKEKTNRILGDETVCLWGQSYITDTIHLKKCPDWKAMDITCDTNYCDDYEDMQIAVDYQISPQSFYQVNPVQTEKLYSTAMEFADLTGNEIVWDLYCGIGTISLFLSQKAKQVYGVEIVPQAIEDARKNAKENHITNAEFFVGKAEEVLPQNKHLLPDVIVVDPPRKGCDEMCLQTMVQMAPKRIVYVSCDSATLARDLKYLCANGYEIKKVQAFDQFGHTTHVESVVLITRKEK